MAETYYKSNREKCLAAAKKWQAEHPEQERQRKRKYYLKHRDKLRLKNNEYNKVNREKIRQNKRNHARRRAFWALCSSANRRFNEKLKPGDLWRIAHKQRLVCALTGEKLTRANISVDHILPKSKGGKNIPSNIRLTTRDVNWFRRTMDDAELLTMCKKVVCHLSAK